MNRKEENVKDFVLSAFGDEVNQELSVQLDVLAGAGLEWIEVRGAWDKPMLEWDDRELGQAIDMIAERGFRVSAVASPIGKSELERPREFERQRLKRAIHAANLFRTRLIRIFSFYVAPGRQTQTRTEVLERLNELVHDAQEADVVLLHENEKEIYGDTPERCREIVSQINSPHLRVAFDPANFVQVGVLPMTQAYPLLADYIAHVHIKDARLNDGRVVLPGKGDGQLPALLGALREQGYHGVLTLEPHLIESGPMRGRSGADGMRLAVRSLRELMQGLPIAPSGV